MYGVIVRDTAPCPHPPFSCAVIKRTPRTAAGLAPLATGEMEQRPPLDTVRAIHRQRTSLEVPNSREICTRLFGVAQQRDEASALTRMGSYTLTPVSKYVFIRENIMLYSNGTKYILSRALLEISCSIL